jgi:type II secretory pathway pseudopilin PulG
MRSRSAFTLLEVLLAVGLIIMLFAGIFVFYDHAIQSRAKAQRAAQESQLARAVLVQIAEDLNSGSSLPGIIRRITSRGGMRVIGSPSGSTPAAPQSGSPGTFVGAASSISFQSSRCIPLNRFIQTEESSVEGGAPVDQTNMLPPVSDLQQIQWYWQYDAATNTSGGLFRTRRPAVVPPPQEGSAAAGLELDPDAAPESQPDQGNSQTGDTVNIDTGDETPDPLMDIECVSPEVKWVYFRYFDGETWTDSYDESEAGQLPLAVEMTIGFEPLLSQEQFDSGMKLEDRLAELFGEDSQEALPPHSYRTVVYLRSKPPAPAAGGFTIQGLGR